MMKNQSLRGNETDLKMQVERHTNRDKWSTAVHHHFCKTEQHLGTRESKNLGYVRTRQSKKAREKDIAKMERELKRSPAFKDGKINILAAQIQFAWNARKVSDQCIGEYASLLEVRSS
ncbi:uncharacterized protein LOC122529085 [Frieseomelitta varia]|uniref:uncharacterized protein LOC122529085 n=1 Tax=Frieseomelitta varia TaxID=561572 RepID=UPI001CB68E2F|nr:uncharacterized protein LOC122529085 [Frieseomelitta varia]